MCACVRVCVCVSLMSDLYACVQACGVIQRLRQTLTHSLTLQVPLCFPAKSPSVLWPPPNRHTHTHTHTHTPFLFLVSIESVLTFNLLPLLTQEARPGEATEGPSCLWSETDLLEMLWADVGRGGTTHILNKWKLQNGKKRSLISLLNNIVYILDIKELNSNINTDVTNAVVQPNFHFFFAYVGGLSVSTEPHSLWTMNNIFNTIT